MLPVMLNLRNRRVVVFGGGRVAERRVAKLLQAGAEVRVVSRSFTRALQRLAALPELTLVRQELTPEVAEEHARDAVLVFVATSDGELNEAIAERCCRLGRLVNRADAVADFVMPASFSVGDVVVAVATGGRSPEVAKMIKRRLMKAVAQEDILLVELQERLRGELRRLIATPEERRRVLRRVARDQDVLRMLKEGDTEGALKLAMKLVEAEHAHG
ncbi:MAG: bifunctional precorrin-2 dehydrogenase/sirohydrochlorin ferrochelatase [Euryarchaeota archaeon]|nr:bifunctional precorrin-2 dehydrogenase/sirohydrochlorin ferrochelatase [Euryarchaeota archaeon]